MQRSRPGEGEAPPAAETVPDLRPVLGYVLFVFAAWSAYVSTAYGWVSRAGPVLRPLANEAVRAAIFVVPVVYLLRRGADGQRLPLRRVAAVLRLIPHAGRGVGWGALAGAALLAAHATAQWAFHGGVHPGPVPAEAWLTSLGLATLAEEVAFRGYLLQRLRARLGFWPACLASAALFAAIHLPGWLLAGGVAPGPGLLRPLAEIVALGVALGLMLRWTGSLWACCLLHAANNLAFILFYRSG